MIKTFTDELVLMSRHLNLLERDAICCGTVTVQQCFVLQKLAEDSALNSELAESAGSSPSAMTRLVDGLIRSDWAERVPDPDDRRKAVVQLTKSGKEEANRLRGLTEQTLDSVLRAIPEEKREQVIESVHLLRVALDNLGGFSCC